MTAVPHTVCMATFNGGKYVLEQLQSILVQLGDADEVIVVDDCSSDNTVELVHELGDPRVRVYVNERNLGHVASFQRGIEGANGRIIYLADQDDVWAPGRVKLMDASLAEASVVAGALRVFSDSGFNGLIGFQRNDVKNLAEWFLLFVAGRLPYFGSAMAFRAELRTQLLPFPAYVEAHDHWLATLGAANKSIAHLTQVVTYRRQHDRNLSPRRRRPIHLVLATRHLMVKMLVDARARMRHSG